MAPRINQSFDTDTGVLYVLREDSNPSISDHATDDMNVVFSLDASNNVVGITLLHADLLDKHSWLSHPARKMLPNDLRLTVDRWIFAQVSE